MPEPKSSKASKPSPLRQAIDILDLMSTNGWNQAEAATHLGLSRARVTQILNVLKIPKAEIDRMKEDGVKITEQRLRNL